MIKNKKAVIFDLDGTLFDSMQVWKDIDKEFFEENGFDVDYAELMKDIEGSSMLETADYFINRFSMPVTRNELVAKWNDMAFHHYSKLVGPKPGAIEFVKRLSAEKYKIAVASSNSRVLIDAVLNAHNVYDLIDEIVTSDDVKKGKPEPDVYLEAARRINVDPCDCLIFEDVIAGIEAGKRANMCTCAISDDYSEADWDEKKKLADYYINDYYEVLKLFDE